MERRCIEGKKAVSPVIASVLLILLVLILASLIFLWARGFISEQIEKFGKNIESVCDEVQFDVEKTKTAQGISVLEIVNRGNVDIYNLEVKVFKGGNSVSRRFKFSVDAGESQRASLDLSMNDGTEPEEIIIYPALIGNVKGKDSNRVFTCIDQGKSIEV